jgi:beta-fructofuranosidase
MYTVEKANQYIKENSKKVNKQFRLKYHGMSEVGWMNDPNGVVFYKGQYHVFYQYYPYDSVWGPMHWGHMVSDDLVEFNHLPVALAPDQPDETGCFSGGAIVDANNKDILHLLYTKHYEMDGYKIETQGLATSHDGIHFAKNQLPIIGLEDLPNHANRSDFRDPKPFYYNGYYYIFVGSKNHSNEGQFLIYRSKDLKEYEYFDTLVEPNYFGVMGECPDISIVDGYSVFLFSGIEIKEQDNKFKNCNSSLSIIGHFDFENKKYDFLTIDEIDKGHDFYAPQTLVDDQGRTIMIAWMEMWGKEYLTHKQGDNWCGALTFPRELKVKDQVLYQYPVEELKNYHKSQVKLNSDQLISKQMDLLIDETNQAFKLNFVNPDNEMDYFSIRYDGEKVYFNGENIELCPLDERSTTYHYQEVQMRVLLDTSSVEVFVNKGREAITSRVYIKGDHYRLTTEGTVNGQLFELNM